VVADVDGAAVTLKNMEQYSMEIKKPGFSPDNIEKKWSFVSYKDASELDTALQTVGYKKSGTQMTTAKSDSDWTWEKTVEAPMSGALTVDRPTK
jgi:hypothetical protein